MTYRTVWAEDHAKNPGLQISNLEEFLDDINAQPEWRLEADRAANYYDGRQLEPDVIEKMRARGQPILIHNLIQPAINGVLGMEAKTRTDWIVRADDDEGTEVAEALNIKLNEAARLTLADRACSDAFGSQIKTGLGWVEVNRNTDPFDVPYRVNCIHRNEIWWDWHAERPDLKDARWLMRRKWLDFDHAKMAFPQHEELLLNATHGWSSFNYEEGLQSQSLLGAYTDYDDFRVREEEWWDSVRKRIALFEVWYRQYVNKPVIKTHTGQVMLFDKTNRLHLAALAADKAMVEYAIFPVMRLSYFAGPHRLADLPSPHPHNHFPYVPFWGYVEDATKAPYGVIRGMMPSQDEVNKRKSKLTQILNSYQVIKDHNALQNMSENQLLDELHQNDTVINLSNSNARFEINTEQALAAQQFDVMKEAERMIQETAGIYSSFLGQESSAKSGIAINSLVEQGSVTMSEITDNYQFARQQVGELLLANIVQDLSKQENVAVKTHADKPEKSKIIYLNQRDDKGLINNNVARTKSRVVLGDISSSPGYRAQVSQILMEITKSMPPELQMALMHVVIESTDLPNREELSRIIRKVTGQGVDPEQLTDEERAEIEQQQQMGEYKQKLEMRQVELLLEKLEAESRKLNAQAAEAENKAGMVPTQEAKAAAETQKIIAEIKDLIPDIAAKRRQLISPPMAVNQ